jgi:hypothetical protein
MLQQRYAPRLAANAVNLLLAAWRLHPVALMTSRVYRRANNGGHAYNAVLRRESETVRHVDTHLADTAHPIYTIVSAGM